MTLLVATQRLARRLLAVCLLLMQASSSLPARPPAPPGPNTPIRIDVLWYRVGGLNIRAVVCRPDLLPGRPLLNLVHGGLDSQVDQATCRRFARLGYVVAASALRGQGGSQGRPEICAGEVSDVRALRTLAQRRFHTDPTRVGYLGVSLGGCTAIKAAAAENDAQAVVTLLSPTDFAEQLRVLSPVRPDAVARWEALLGGSAQTAPAIYEGRRPLKALKQLNAPLLTMAAGRDQLVPLRQSCVVAAVRRAAGHTVAEVRQMQDGQPGDLHGPGRCPGAALARLPQLAGQDVLLVYEDLGHTSTPLMWKMAERYLAANLRLTR